MSYLIVILGIIGIVAFSVKFTQIAVVRPLRKQIEYEGSRTALSSSEIYDYKKEHDLDSTPGIIDLIYDQIEQNGYIAHSDLEDIRNSTTQISEIKQLLAKE